MLMLDSGLMLRLLDMTLGDVQQITSDIMTASAADLVNKGPLAEMVVGLELLRYKTSNMRHELYYWLRQERNSMAEIDYVTTKGMNIMPIEVKAGTQGGMKSLWLFMREKKLKKAVRCSLENFGVITYTDKEAGGEEREVRICPMYAISMLNKVLEEM
jgi:predicted AAA+ superfamily ATPase